MRRVPSSLELAGCTILSIFGLYMLYEGTTDRGTILLISGALCFMLSIIALIAGLKNIIWHRQMLRQSASRQDIDHK
jgi:hypothetical protein